MHKTARKTVSVNPATATKINTKSREKNDRQKVIYSTVHRTLTDRPIYYFKLFIHSVFSDFKPILTQSLEVVSENLRLEESSLKKLITMKPDNSILKVPFLKI